MKRIIQWKWIVAGALMIVCGERAYSEASVPASLLNRRADLPGIGQIAYRSPVPGSSGPVVVLFQGIFGGVTYRHFGEVRELLDRAGARVFTMDLPGTGESASPKIVYDMATVDLFVREFLRKVVKEPAIVVGEQLLGLAALEVAKSDPQLFSKLVLVQPTGIRYIAGPPSQQQELFFEKFWNDDQAALQFYLDLVSEKSARYYLKKSYYDPAQVTESRVEEILFTARFTEQRWASVCFVGGRIFRSFADASRGVHIPVTVVMGAHPTAPVASGQPETLDLFQAVQPAFRYVPIPQSANLPHRERPEDVLREIL